jgi:hypothetical protein
MNSKRKVNSQQILEGKENIIDKNRLRSSKSVEYQVLSDLLKKFNQSKIKSMEKILIIGEFLIEIFSQLYKISPDAQFYIANSSNEPLESFKRYFKRYKNYSTYILDVSKGVSLHDFVFYNGKFDLVIINKVYSQLSIKKRNLSMMFLYKHYLYQYGILCIITDTKNTTQLKSSFIRNIKPVLEKDIPVKNKKSADRFIFYMRKNREI